MQKSPSKKQGGVVNLNHSPRQYLLMQDGEEEAIIAGPFAPGDDNELEEAFVMALSCHPWDDSPTYRLLLIDELGAPEIELFSDEYLALLMKEAWMNVEEVG